MMTVNGYFVDAFLGPLGGLADVDETPFDSIDGNDEQAIRKVIRDELKPHFERWDDKSKRIARDSLAYWLSFRRHELGPLYNGMLMPFDPPNPPELFFLWLWEELFGPEDWRLEDPKAFQVQNDPHLANLIRVAPEPD